MPVVKSHTDIVISPCSMSYIGMCLLSREKIIMITLALYAFSVVPFCFIITLWDALAPYFVNKIVWEPIY